jgi:hypothetical protein
MVVAFITDETILDTSRYKEISMYKLRATLRNGLTFVTMASTVLELQRIATSLNSTSYWIELYGDTVFSL